MNTYNLKIDNDLTFVVNAKSDKWSEINYFEIVSPFKQKIWVNHEYKAFILKPRGEDFRTKIQKFEREQLQLLFDKMMPSFNYKFEGEFEFADQKFSYTRQDLSELDDQYMFTLLSFSLGAETMCVRAYFDNRHCIDLTGRPLRKHLKTGKKRDEKKVKEIIKFISTVLLVDENDLLNASGLA